MSAPRPPQICLFGASGDTSNLGVSALMESAVLGLAQRCPDLRLTVFDNGWGIRESSVVVEGRPFGFHLCGARLSRRYHRPESLWNMRISGWLGGVGNAGVRRIRTADAVLDVSGGDSFSDIYGQKRLRSMLLPKQIVVQQRTPLVLLPQTYGPFSGVAARRSATSILARASMAWARDADSFQSLRDLLGNAYHPDRHRQGVDMAFALEGRRPEDSQAREILDWLAVETSAPTAGLNVSGLLYNDPSASSHYGLRSDYRTLVAAFLQQLLRNSDARVLLVPHVVGGSFESDVSACAALAGALHPDDRKRVAIAPRLGASEVKWVISQLDWFCGTRMHSTIAALSSGVPAAAIAYSIKTRGVFETCGQEQRVADARTLANEQVLDLLWKSWSERQEAQADLAKKLPQTLERAQHQMDIIFQRCLPQPTVGSDQPRGKAATDG